MRDNKNFIRCFRQNGDGIYHIQLHFLPLEHDNDVEIRHIKYSLDFSSCVKLLRKLVENGHTC